LKHWHIDINIHYVTNQKSETSSTQWRKPGILNANRSLKKIIQSQYT